MATKSVTTSEDWRELAKAARELVPDDVFDHIPMRFAEEEKTIRFHGSRISLYVIIDSYTRWHYTFEDLCEAYPHMNSDDIRTVIDYYESTGGAWIDEYIALLTESADVMERDFKRRWEAGEYPARNFGLPKNSKPAQ